MIQEIQNYMKFASITANDFRARPCFAHVLNVNTQNYTAQVELQPSGQTTPFLPILSHWIGNGWGMYSPPSVGDQVFVHFLEDDIASGLVSLYGYNNVDKALNCPVGEFWLVHKEGAKIKLKNDGSIEISSETTINVSANVVNVQAEDVVVTSDHVTINSDDIDAGNAGSIQKIVTEAFVGLFNGHTHGSSPTPDQTMGDGQLTENFKAS